ncbi:MAG: NAD(P)-binding protein [Alphaproteobacteria bacterium]|nr:NAD(P)-binding protein [Alphaproteobacteria bacterium]
MMLLSRRQLLAALGATAAACADPPKRTPPPPPVRDLSASLMARGHLLRGPAPDPALPKGDPLDLAIVGAGVAGLSAAWRLRGADLRMRVFELGAAAGGTAGQGEGPHGPFPLGAHYITLPSPGARALRALLTQLGVITGFDGQGRPRYRDTDLCFAPQERLYAGGEWVEGLWPERLTSAEEEAQRAAWEAEVARFAALRGADDRPAFAIPVALSSLDPALRALANERFSDWLDARGFTAPALRWMLEYATRDDYGTTLADTSAWAGLHYHCARRPDPAEALGTHVLTWPGGNGWLVQQLLALCPAPVETGVLVRRVVRDGPLCTLQLQRDAGMESVQARHVILAVPARVADRLVERAPAPRPDFAPWRVVSLHCDRPPRSRGEPLAWDSVLYQGEGLGYVNNAHQRADFEGPCTLTWYAPLSGSDPAAEREALARSPAEDSARMALQALQRGHPDILERVTAAEVMHWGHGTVRPVLGLHADPLAGPLAQAAAALPGLSFAHTDLSGLSLFEEAQWHGVRAAEEALSALERPLGESLL